MQPGWPPWLSVLVLYSRVEAVTDGEPLDILAEQETARVAEEIAAGLQGLGYHVACVGVTDDVEAAIEPFSPEEWLVFNVCESPGGDPTLEASVPPLLEARGFAYTGSPGETLAVCLDKAQTKARLAAAGLPTPRCAVLSAPTQPCDVPLPALVKPVAEDGSLGIGAESVVCDHQALARRVAYVVERYRQPALVEEFIAGREFNQAVWGNHPPQPLPTGEINFQGIDDPLQQICTYESKWVEDSFAYRHTPGVCPARLDPELRARLVKTAVAAYRLLGCRDYARVDIREREGIPYILEVNPNPTLASDAGFYRAARVAGFDHPRMAEHIVAMAWERWVGRGKRG